MAAVLQHHMTDAKQQLETVNGNLYLIKQWFSRMQVNDWVFNFNSSVHTQ